MKNIPGTLGFLASEDGKIFDCEENRRAEYTNLDGYITVAVKLDSGIWTTMGVHRLVALAYKSDGMVGDRTHVNHRDCDKKNNHYSNLEWVTVAENCIHNALMSKNNSYPRLVIERPDQDPELVLNLMEAAKLTGLKPLEIWDCVKDKKPSKDGISFRHLRFNAALPAQIRPKPRFTKRGSDGKATPTPLKVLDTETGEILLFDSFKQAAGYFDTNSSHLYYSISRHWDAVLKLFRKKYLLTYQTEDFRNYTPEELAEARSRGPKAVYAFNVNDRKSLITNHAKEAYEILGLSKKAVTKSLAENNLRVIDGWVLTYFTPENVSRLNAFVESPVSA